MPETKKKRVEEAVDLLARNVRDLLKQVESASHKGSRMCRAGLAQSVAPDTGRHLHLYAKHLLYDIRDGDHPDHLVSVKNEGDRGRRVLHLLHH